MFSDVINLISNVVTKTNTGDIINMPSLRMVYANKLSVRQNEHYQAQSIGLQPELMFEIRTEEYAAEKMLQYDSKNYTIDRVYSKIGLTELICTRIVGDR
jgi:SPP1 family predicted phage head-tail adaptor